jgi:NAD(P)-dependent dehydrogenase (short-subunit alcohol dehydrogenase family)
MSRKVALVTGATRGIGRVAALELSRRGFAVVVTGRTLREGQGILGNAEQPDAVPGSIEATVADIERTSGEALGVRLDLLDRESIDAAIDATLARFGRLDVLFNNGLYQGLGLMSPIADISMEAAEDNFLGSVINQLYISRRAISVMKGQGHGRIIFIGSLASISPPQHGGGFLYAGGKAAYNRIPEFIHFEHAKDGILAFLIEPQFTMTDTIKARWGDQMRWGDDTVHPPRQPEETARTVAWLATHPDAARFAGGPMINAPDFFAINGIQPDD